MKENRAKPTPCGKNQKEELNKKNTKEAHALLQKTHTALFLYGDLILWYIALFGR
jgi:hypothetical protein